jgi:hypothetical protein
MLNHFGIDSRLLHTMRLRQSITLPVTQQYRPAILTGAAYKRRYHMLKNCMSPSNSPSATFFDAQSGYRSHPRQLRHAR